MIGPTLGGWLYEAGGIGLPFVTLAGAAVLVGLGFLWLRLPDTHSVREAVPIARHSARAGGRVVRARGRRRRRHDRDARAGPARCFWQPSSAHGPGSDRPGVRDRRGRRRRLLHPVFGHLADRWGGAPTDDWAGLLALGPCCRSSASAGVSDRRWRSTSLQAVSRCRLSSRRRSRTWRRRFRAPGFESFGVAYGLYNFAWALGLLAGPAAGGFLYERMGFERLTTRLGAWSSS